MQGSRSPKAILFDLGGVLLPFDRELRIRALIDHFGCGQQLARAFMAHDIHRQLDTGEAGEDELAAAFTAYFGRPVEPVAATLLVLSVFRPPNLELWDLVGALRDRAIVGGFSDNPVFVEAAFPAGATLDPMFFSSRIGACKPSPEAFAAVEVGLSLAPQDILFIDDTPANVEAALARGWDAIHFTGNAPLMVELAQRGLR